MKDLFCEHFEIEIRFSSDEFDREALEKDVKTKIEDDDSISWAYGSRDKSKEEHAHIWFRFSSNKKHTTRITFHSFEGDVDDQREPFMENCVAWLASFFKTEPVAVTLRAAFSYNPEFVNAISLPFPLVAATDDMAGAIVSGMSIDFPKKFGIDSAQIQLFPKETLISVRKRAKLHLKDFDLESEIQKLSECTMKLVRKVEKQDGESTVI